MRLRLLIAGLGLVLAACGPSATQTPLASPAASSPTTGHADPFLESLLPASVDGVALSTVSGIGPEVFGGDAFSQSMAAYLLARDLTSADFTFAQAWDPNESLDLELGAFRVPGIPAEDLAAAVVEASKPNAPGLTAGPASLGGRAVTAVVYPGGGPTLYLFPRDDVLFYVGTADEDLGARVIGLLR